MASSDAVFVVWFPKTLSDVDEIVVALKMKDSSLLGTHKRHCVVTLSKILYYLLSTGLAQENVRT